MHLDKSSRFKLGSLFLVAVLLTAACGDPSTPTRSSASDPTTSSTATFVPLPTVDLTPSAANIETSPTNTAVPTITETLPPTAAPSETPRPTATLTADPTTSLTPKIYRENLYSTGAVRYQDPDMTACTAASTLMMLNFVAARSPSPGALVWSPTTSYTVQGEILAYERANMTMLITSAGSDPHGWRNALNYYGWGSIDAGVYVDQAFDSYDSASKAAIIALAQTGKPVGILAWGGKHAQILNAFMVTGADPATGSTDFTINTVYITDPLASDAYRNYAITSATWQNGNSHIAFVPYHETDSPYTDPIDGQVGKTEWYNKWVIIAPVR
jgi:hypothetical protein